MTVFSSSKACGIGILPMHRGMTPGVVKTPSRSPIASFFLREITSVGLFPVSPAERIGRMPMPH